MITSAYIFAPRFTGLREGDIHRLTHANIAFAEVQNGRATVAHWGAADAAVRDLLRNRGNLQVLLSVGGWGAGGFSPAVASADARAVFADSLMQIVDAYGFDGIDMDWEYPCDVVAGIEASPADRPNYTAFMQLLRKKLGAGRLLTMAAGGMQSAADNLELPQLMQVMDFINLMTYDICPWTFVGHHTPLFSGNAAQPSADAVVQIYTRAGVAPGDMVLGSGFYGRSYSDVDGLGAAFGGTPGIVDGGYAGVVTALAGITPQYDAASEAAYAYNAATREFITFESPRSARAKMDYVRKEGLRGIMFWEYCHDDANSTLLKALADK